MSSSNTNFAGPSESIAQDRGGVWLSATEPSSYPLIAPSTNSELRKTRKRIHDELGLLNVTSVEFNKCIESVDNVALQAFDFHVFYLNLLSIFRSSLPPDRVCVLSRAAVKNRLWSWWEYAKCMQTLADSAATADVPMLRGWDVGQIRRLLSKQRGLIICTPHYGVYRFIGLNLAALGFTVTNALDSDSHQSFEQLVNYVCNGRRNFSTPATEAGFERRLFTCDVEKNRLATAVLASKLLQNQIVIIYIDGNTGIDGPHGFRNRINIEFFEQRLVVKSGFAHLAVAVGAPVLPIIAERAADYTGTLQLDSPICPPPNPNKNDRDIFVRDCIQKLYMNLQKAIVRSPHQWESCRLSHRWRSRESWSHPGQAEVDRAPIRMEALLASQLELALDRSRAVMFPLTNGVAFVDAQTLRTLTVGAALGSVAQSLWAGDKATLQWVSRCNPNIPRDSILDLLARLYRLGLLHSCNRPLPVVTKSVFEEEYHVFR